MISLQRAGPVRRSLSIDPCREMKDAAVLFGRCVCRHSRRAFDGPLHRSEIAAIVHGRRSTYRKAGALGS
jgi:hypothetical protein